MISRFIGKIPAGVWIALAVAVGLAAIGGGAAVRRARAPAPGRRGGGVTAAAITDQLTGVLNRRGFTQSGRARARARARYGHPLALAYVDVRGLKGVNDTEGHLAGDRLLKEVALMLSESARTHDLVGRIGGDELAVLLAEQACRRAPRDGSTRPRAGARPPRRARPRRRLGMSRSGRRVSPRTATRSMT